MRIRIPYLIIVTALLLSSCGVRSKLPSLVESYSKKDKKPFGAEIAYRQINALYNGNIIRDKRLPFETTWQTLDDTGALYICMAPELFLTEADADAMMDYVYEGNSLFISAGFIDELLLNKVGCREIYTDPKIQKLTEKMTRTSLRSVVKPASDYGYYYYPFQNYFAGIDSSHTRVLGYNAHQQPNFLVHYYGSGRLYLQCEPRAFSNYFLLSGTNFEYLNSAMAFTRSEPEHVYWDDYYHKLRSRKREKGFSSFSEIMKYPALKFAFWLSLATLLLYVLFSGKYLQRVIPPIKPNENTSVTFTETIGHLYLQKKDNKNIADKMITYFNEYIRNTYFLNTNHINNDFVAMLSRKSGVEKDRVDTLYRSISATQGSREVTDYQLLSLHEQIQEFYKMNG